MPSIGNRLGVRKHCNELNATCNVFEHPTDYEYVLEHILLCSETTEFARKMEWTVDDIPDQSQRVILITGATTGVGYECARSLARRGAHVVLACRNREKMASVAEILRSDGAKAVEELVCDLNDTESVHAFAENYNGPDIDVLLLNAGTLAESFERSAQKYERSFATNHLAHWLLTGLLLAKVRDRVVVVSSSNHHDAQTIDWASVECENTAGNGLARYSQSKLANMLFVEELNRKLVENNSSIVAVGAHPGFAKSQMLDKVDNPGFLYLISKFMMTFMAQPTENGAWPLLMAATDDKIDRECYYAPSNWRIRSEMCGPPIRNGSKNIAVKDVELAKKLWEKSETYTSFKYKF